MTNEELKKTEIALISNDIKNINSVTKMVAVFLFSDKIRQNMIDYI